MCTAQLFRRMSSRLLWWGSLYSCHAVHYSSLPRERMKDRRPLVMLTSSHRNPSRVDINLASGLVQLQTATYSRFTLHRPVCYCRPVNCYCSTQTWLNWPHIWWCKNSSTKYYGHFYSDFEINTLWFLNSKKTNLIIYDSWSQNSIFLWLCEPETHVVSEINLVHETKLFPGNWLFSVQWRFLNLDIILKNLFNSGTKREKTNRLLSVWALTSKMNGRLCPWGEWRASALIMKAGQISLFGNSQLHLRTSATLSFLINGIFII